MPMDCRRSVRALRRATPLPWQAAFSGLLVPQDPSDEPAFDDIDDEFLLLDEFLKARARQGLTQAQVAERIGTTQSAVARMESGKGKHSPSFATLSRYADALGCRLEVRLVRKRGAAKDLTGRSSDRASRPANH